MIMANEAHSKQTRQLKLEILRQLEFKTMHQLKIKRELRKMVIRHNLFCDFEFHAYAIIRQTLMKIIPYLVSIVSIYTGFVCIISIAKSIII